MNVYPTDINANAMLVVTSLCAVMTCSEMVGLMGDRDYVTAYHQDCTCVDYARSAWLYMPMYATIMQQLLFLFISFPTGVSNGQV
jgi:hypothetical protein